MGWSLMYERPYPQKRIRLKAYGIWLAWKTELQHITLLVSDKPTESAWRPKVHCASLPSYLPGLSSPSGISPCWCLDPPPSNRIKSLSQKVCNRPAQASSCSPQIARKTLPNHKPHSPTNTLPAQTVLGILWFDCLSKPYLPWPANDFLTKFLHMIFPFLQTVGARWRFPSAKGWCSLGHSRWILHRRCYLCQIRCLNWWARPADVGLWIHCRGRGDFFSWGKYRGLSWLICGITGLWGWGFLGIGLPQKNGQLEIRLLSSNTQIVLCQN